MKYAVVISEIAASQIDEAYAWLVDQTIIHAPEWHKGLLKAIDSLEELPLRCPLVSSDEDPSQQARQLLYGNKRHAYRIIFDIIENTVIILQVIHSAGTAKLPLHIPISDLSKIASYATSGAASRIFCFP